ncbi:cutinase family protein [Nocardia sp. CA-135953]|uniref:cutinase family protein n=1 Tax=Nocardia sp. CA-135953 TaxID=3239978 RepID=UPI003D96AAFF
MLAGTATAIADDTAQVPGPSCPGLYVLGVQGTSESSPGASLFDNTGMLGEMFRPMLANGVSIGHAFVPYPASFGGVIGTGAGTDSYVDSVQAARTQLDAMATQVIAQCPDTKLAAAGYSQGAEVLSSFAADVGSGTGPVPADKVAGIALLSNPSRATGTDPFPGRPGQMTPSPAPGSAGELTSRVRINPVPPTGGITASGSGYGDLSGRVAEFCIAGDLSCDAPANDAALRTVAGLAAQADLRDPIVAAQSLTNGWSATVADTRTSVLVNDVSVVDGQVTYAPSRSVSQRLAEAADPRSAAPTAEQTQAANDKADQVVSAVLADPLGQIPRLVGQIIAAIGQNIADNSDLANPAVLGRYLDVHGNHTGYGTDGQTANAADWFSALSRDLAGGAGR